ncbi:D-tyrosyl-tRNA(Tyr) deacylase [Candidatus Microgenomates bacterium]|nr:D-tyrosyl-tRNA(Tyr) deacylase [Candidatus Microgenomates bacterium]
MKLVIQRVKKASVKVNNKIIGRIDQGLVVLLGIVEKDAEKEVRILVDKLSQLRLFVNKENKFDKSLLDIAGEVLVVPQFTLYADTSKGRRPYFGSAAKPKIAKPLFEKFVEILKEKGVKVEKGQFGAKMEVELINDGPVTIILES